MLVLVLLIPIVSIPLIRYGNFGSLEREIEIKPLRLNSKVLSNSSFGYENLSTGIRLFNSELNITVSTNGSVFTQWLIKDINVELANKTSEFQGLPMYFPMDILPDLGWNEENYRYLYSVNTIEESPSSIKIMLNRTLSNNMDIQKIIEIFPNRADINITEIIYNPTSDPYNLTSVWNPSGVEGFMIDLIGLKQEKLTFRHKEGVEIDSGLHWQWLNVTDLKWMGLYEPDSYARIVRPFNDTSSVYGEWTSWDAKIGRLSFLPYVLSAYDSVKFKYNLYGGAIDFVDLNNSALSDFYLFATGPNVNLDFQGIWTIGPSENFTAKLEMTSPNILIQNMTLNYFVNDVLLNETFNIDLPINATRYMNYSLPYPNTEGVYTLKIVGIVNNLDIFQVQKSIVVLDDTITRDPVSISFVFHHHQPWYINPTDNFIQPFAQSFGELYYQHLQAQYDFPDIHVSANLQPSLIEQWNRSLNGYTIELPTGELEHFSKDSGEVALVQKLLNEYSTLGSTDRLEILSSPYFHPILAILGNNGYEEDGIAQIRLGLEKTSSLLGISAKGLWSPEQTFNNFIIPMLNKSNIQYTILDDRLLADSYPGFTNRQPYYLVDPNTQLQTIAFFRDSTISNNIAFNWNGYRDGDEAVREFLSNLAQIYFLEQDQSINGKIHVTLGMDGENWLTENDLLTRMFQVIHENPFMTTQTLAEQFLDNPPANALWDLREGSWGRQTSLITWQGTPAKDWVWEQIENVRDSILVANATLSPTNDYRKTMMFDYFISQGSDYTFWEETNPSPFALFASTYANMSKELALQIIETKPNIDSVSVTARIDGEDLIFNLNIQNFVSQPLFLKLRARIFNEGRVLVDDKRSEPFEVNPGIGSYEIKILFPQWVSQIKGESFEVNITFIRGYSNFRVISKMISVRIQEETTTITTTATTKQSTFGFSSFLVIFVLLNLSFYLRTWKRVYRK
jgi:alpha-amylase/alpha-mannosidase (GH57 family)